VLGVSALHYSTGSQEGFWTLASACVAAPDYLLLLSKYFRCIPEVPRMSRSVQELSRSLEVNLELSIVQRGEHRGSRIKLRVLDATILFSEVWKLRLKVQEFRTRLSRQLNENQG